MLENHEVLDTKLTPTDREYHYGPITDDDLPVKRGAIHDVRQ